MSAFIGFLLVLLFFAVIIGGAVFILTKVAPRVLARQRDRQIETAMRLGMRDAEAQQRIAQKLRNERNQR